MRQPGLAEVHLVIDHAREQILTPRIDYLGVIRRRDSAADLFDTIADHEDVGIPDAALVDEARVTD